MTKAHRQQLYIFFVLLFFCSLFALFFSLADGKSAAADSSFDGTGTKADPYLIETKEDFFAFADAVNGGMSFDGKYFLQTQDIDFASEQLSPVGAYGEGNYFYGTYDGGGHRLYNVNIDESTTGYAGLFGTLGGSVYNLGIESGTIKGYCAGSFAANAAGGTAEIFNCYSRATITSVLRGGGIADNFAGLVYNCVSMATNNGSYADLCSYNGRLVHNSYTLGNNINAVVSRDQVITDSECVSESEVKTLSFSYTMNGGVFDFAEAKGDMFLYRDYSFWTVRNGLLCFASASSSLITASSSWEGDGSKENPYLISSASDFQRLIEQVNGGETYTGLYFKQTADIDFGYRPMKSIGVVGTGTAFYGTYDGAGHTLYRYCVDNGAGYNTGVFGLLGGKVMNLGLEEGYIFGECLGAISVNSVYGYTVIYNCYSKATMYGYRGGGIADNFSGMIFNCVSDATINGKTAPLGAYLIRDVEYCYSTGKIVSTNYFETSNENVTVTVAQLYSASVTETLNYNAMILSVNNGMCALAETANWDLDGSGGFDGFIDSSILDPKAYFKGKGSRSDPYIIDSVDDFIFFHNSVNAGAAYNGRYVKQTVDLDFEGETLNPIGIFDSGNYFYGTYDGAGHTISNLNIKQDYGRELTGLFGTLAGFVYNLGYVSGTVYGEIAAGIAYYGSTAEGAIVNCYFTGSIYAFRASGITDSFRGAIINCWCDGKNNYDGSTYPLNAIVATKIVHCFATGELNASGYEDSVIDSSVIDSSLLSDERFAFILNAGCLYTARESVCTLQSLSSWEIVSGTLRQGDKFKKSYSSYISGFSGLGTKWRPYKIKDADDLLLLQLATAAGEEYKNQYFVQTRDIDCSSLTNAVPIGELASHVFYAEYDGQGYKITNLVLNSSIYDGSCAFIRTLGGTVKNLYLKNCTFAGDIAAGIACYTDYLATTRIINCIVTDSIIAGSKASAGVLAYGRETRIYNCLYLYYDARSSAYFCLQADKLYGCYTNGIFHDEDYLYAEMENCAKIDGVNMTISETIAAMNANIIALKVLLNENIVGEFARFAADGEEGIRFDGFFRITIFNLADCLPVLGYDISLYMMVILAIVIIAGSFMADIALYRRKKEAERRKVKEEVQGGDKIPDAMIDSPDKFYAKRNRGLSRAEDKLLGKAERTEVERDASRVSVLAAQNAAREERRLKRLETRRAREQEGKAAPRKKEATPSRIRKITDGEAENGEGEGNAEENPQKPRRKVVPPPPDENN